jgi:hypothetical protein
MPLHGAGFNYYPDVSELLLAKEAGVNAEDDRRYCVGGGV